MKRFAIWAVVAVVLILTLSAGGSLAAGSPNVVISQVYGGGGNSGAPLKNDFVELFNRGATPQSVDGWSVQYASATGTGNFAATPLSGSIPAGGYYLVQEASGAAGVALPAPDAAGTTNMSATGGKVIVANSATSLACNGGSTPCSAAQLAQIVDLVGYDGANFFEGSKAAPTLSNTTAAFRANGGCTDTDDNGADFTADAPAPRNSASAPHACGSATSPTVTGDAATADSGTSVVLTAHVAPGASPASTGLAVTADLTSIGGAATQPFADDGSHTTFTYTAAIPAGTTAGEKTIPLAVTDAEGRSGSGSLRLNVTTPVPSTPIHTIQGAAHISPLAGETVRTSGIVTALRTNGFNLQDPNPDADPATSEGIFVFTSSAPTVAVGDAATVTGRVAEFRPGGASGTGNLTTTELDSPTISVQSHGNPLPAPVVIGVDRTPPTDVIEDDATGDVETSGTFDPAQDGIDFWESLEGMLVEIDDAVAVGPTNSFGETPVVSKRTVPAGRFTPRGGVIAQPGEFNPERVIVDDGIVDLPTMNVGDSYSGPLVGPLDYDFGNFYLEPTTTRARVDGGLTQETTPLVGTQDGLTVATFNLENLAPQDPDSKFAGLADELVDHLKSPDIVALEEVQDNSGATDGDGVVDSSLTLAKLHDAIVAAGGPGYAFEWINPDADQDGGQPGGNIRVVFAYRTDVPGLSFAPGTPGGADDAEAVVGSGQATALKYNPGRIDPTSAAWDASRKPLVGEFAFDGHPVFVVANHWVAKLPDDPLTGHVQPPQQPSETQRVQQAQEVHDFVASLLAANADANVVVLGDLNDFQFSDAVHTLEGNGMLHDLVDTLPANERYSYVFEGNSEVLDQTLVTNALFARSFEYDIVHVNSEFADQTSDHEPQVTRLTFAPVTASAGGPYTVGEGGSVVLHGTGTGDGALSYSWSFGGSGASPTFSAASLDGPQTVPVTLTVTDPDGVTATDSTTVKVTNVAPTATFTAPDSALAPGSFQVSFGAPQDPSAADRAAGFAYAFDCGSGRYAAPTPARTATCQVDDTGTIHVRGKVIDKDGGSTEYGADVEVTVTAASLCAAVGEWAKNDGVANSLCVKLRDDTVRAFDNEVDAQTGKSFTADEAATLERLAGRL